MYKINKYLHFTLFLLQIQSKNERQYFTHLHNKMMLQDDISDSTRHLLRAQINKHLKQCDYMHSIKACLSYINKSSTTGYEAFRPYIPNSLCSVEQVEQFKHTKYIPVYRPTYYPICRSDYRPFFPQKCPPCSQNNSCSTSQEVSTELNALLAKQPALLNSALSLIKDELNTTIITELEALETVLAQKINNRINIEIKYQNDSVTLNMVTIDSIEDRFVRTTLLNSIGDKFGLTKTDITNIINTIAALIDTEIVSIVKDIDAETGLLPQIVSEMDELLVSIKSEMSNNLTTDLLPGVSSKLVEGFNLIYRDLGNSLNTLKVFLPEELLNLIPALKIDMTSSVLKVFTNQTPTIQDVLRNYVNDLKAVASAAITCYNNGTAPSTRVFRMKRANDIVYLPHQDVLN